MSQQIKPVAVRDTVLDLQDSLDYAVYRGGSSISVQKFIANSATSQAHVYAIQVPSTSVVLSRNLVWGSTISLTITGTPAQGEYLVNLAPKHVKGDAGNFYGADCPAPFILNQLCTNMNIQINNTQVSLPVNQVLDPLLRSVDKSFFERWNGSTPTQLDKYGDSYQAKPFQTVLAGTVSPADPGSNIDILQTTYTARFNSPFNNFDNANLNNGIVPRGSFKIDSITGNTAGGTAAGTLVSKTVVITLTVREPVFVSPFLWSEHVDSVGMSGIQQININCQMDSQALRAWRWLCDEWVQSKAITNVSYTNSYMECVFISPKPEDMIPATICTPLQTFTNYKLPYQGANVASGGTGNLTSNSIQLNSYPDKVWVYVDDQFKYVSPGAAAGTALNLAGNGVFDHYATINRVEITLNNRSGLLTTYDLTQLYRASVKSGSQQSFDEFSGLQMAYETANVVDGTPPTYISTTGSVLCLNFGDVIPILESYYAPGSLANTQFQITVYFTNNQQTAIQPQLNLIMCYSGLLATSNGASSAYTSGVLTKESVLSSASVSKPITKEHLARYVGGGLLGDLKAMASSALPMLKSQLLAPAVEKLGSMAVDRLSRKLRA